MKVAMACSFLQLRAEPAEGFAVNLRASSGAAEQGSSRFLKKLDFGKLRLETVALPSVFAGALLQAGEPGGPPTRRGSSERFLGDDWHWDECGALLLLQGGDLLLGLELRTCDGLLDSLYSFS